MDFGSGSLKQFLARPELFLIKILWHLNISFSFSAQKLKKEDTRDAKHTQGLKESCTIHFREIKNQKHVVIALPLVKAGN